MRRRDFSKLALASAVGTVAAPAVVRAQTTFNWKMTSFYGPNAAFYSTGPGSAKDLCKRIEDMSGGRLKIQFYGAGELIPAAEGFDAEGQRGGVENEDTGALASAILALAAVTSSLAYDSKLGPFHEPDSYKDHPTFEALSIHVTQSRPSSEWIVTSSSPP